MAHQSEYSFVKHMPFINVNFTNKPVLYRPFLNKFHSLIIDRFFFIFAANLRAQSILIHNYEAN